jgi:N-ethylmaleimide reductase
MIADRNVQIVQYAAPHDGVACDQGDAPCAGRAIKSCHPRIADRGNRRRLNEASFARQPRGARALRALEGASRLQADGLPDERMKHYYLRRASPGGLVIAEPASISLQGARSPHAPGIYTAEQLEGWRAVVEAVHSRGGLLVAQLSHCGRMAHSSINEEGPVGPSRRRWDGSTRNASGDEVPVERPRALTPRSIDAVLADYRRAGQSTKEVGFDGVEIHGSDGYLVDQFLHDGTNRRSDRYGGSLENRTRFLSEIVDTLSIVWGADRVGVRLSPFGTPNGVTDDDPLGLFTHILRTLYDQEISYAHLVRHTDGRGSSDALASGSPEMARLRSAFPSMLVLSGGFTRRSAINTVQTRRADAIGFGAAFAADPDWAMQLRRAESSEP